MAALAPVFRVVCVECFERDVVLRLPFRFGSATLTGCPQAFVRAVIAFADGASARGAAAEMMVPKWFDKTPDRSPARNVDDLRASLAAAAQAYVEVGGARTAFAHSAAHSAELLAEGRRAERNALTSSYGAALVDRAILDALCRHAGVSFYRAVRGNLPGIGAGLTPDLVGFDLGAFLAQRSTRLRLAARHTVGLLDPVTAADVVTPVDDGLPQTLEQVVATYGHRHFKLKLGGDIGADLARLASIAGVLDRVRGDYVVTLDGNEQFHDVRDVVELWRSLAADPVLARLASAVAFVEQPLDRDAAMRQPVHELAAQVPVLIDESDATLDAFPRARSLGYTGVSSKSCKGLYKSLLNAARVAAWNREAGAPSFFQSAEDLTTQGGLGLQQDLALANVIGVAHVERNGHHYVRGFAGQGAPPVEQQAFLAAQPGLYEARDGFVRVRIDDGLLDISSLDRPGFASGAMPDWASLAPMQAPVHARAVACATVAPRSP
jgi:L-alanine-DL-glutamate epimerase-like enolase superfamily enzyme